MTRFNYLPERHFAPTSWQLTATLAIDNRLRGPFIALAATLILTAAVSVVQLARLHSAERAYALAATRLAADTDAIQVIRSMHARVEAKEQIVQAVATSRRASLLRADELAWIGNHLPGDTWLRALRYEGGGYSLEGSAHDMTAVGNAIVTLRDRDRGTVPQLVSLRDEPNAGAARIRYTLRLETNR